jgi:toluene monooxygenase system ferredoxin subunit
MSFERAMKLSDLKEGETKAFNLKGRKILLLKWKGNVRAYLDRCCHLGQPLSPGRMENGVLTCPLHEWQYDADTGSGINPRGVKLVSVPVEVCGDGIFVEVTA